MPVAEYRRAFAVSIILELNESLAILVGTNILYPLDYVVSLKSYEQLLLDLCRYHRNWNEDLKMINKPLDVLAFSENEPPVGWFEPVVDWSNKGGGSLHFLEEMTDILLYQTSLAELRSPKLNSFYHIRVM